MPIGGVVEIWMLRNGNIKPLFWLEKYWLNMHILVFKSIFIIYENLIMG
jgi:hypothetical protein